jgi:hypothetical protein
MIFQYRGDTVNAAGDLIDVSGENLSPYSDAFNSWATSNASVVVDSYRNPLDGTKNVDVIHEDSTGATSHYVYYSPSWSKVSGNTYTLSSYVYALNRPWVQIGNNANPTARGNFNLVNGTSGTISNAIDYKIQKIIGGWYRVSVTFVATATENDVFYIIPCEADSDYTFDGLNQDSTAVYGAQVVNNTDGYIVGPGLYHATTATTKPRLDLAPTAAPPSIDSSLQDSGGNKLKARSFDGATQYYSRAHHDAMNINDTDHTYTFVASTDAAAVSETYLIHGAFNNSGFSIAGWATTIYAAYFKNAASVSVNGPAGYTGNQYHIIQVVRSNNTATYYLDGNAGVATDVSSFGIDGNQGLYLCSDQGGASGWTNGSVVYFSLDNRALSVSELAKDREEINGYLSGPRQVNPAWSFTRTTTAKQTYSTGGIRNRAINIPRVGDGILIEGQSQNYCLYSEKFDEAAWTKSLMTVSAPGSAIAPDGTLTATTYHEDNSVASIHQMYQNVDYTAASHTYSVYLKYIAARPWVYVGMIDTGATRGAYFNIQSGIVGTIDGGAFAARIEPVGDGWYRCSVSGTNVASVAQYALVVAAESNGDYTFDGGDQDIYYVWGSQVELGSFPTSYISTTNVPVTRTADNLTMDPHTASTNQYILPTIFFAGGPSKLTIEFDAKCEFSSSTDASQMLFLSIGDAGATDYINAFTLTNGRVYFRFVDFVGTSHDIYSAVNPVNFSSWNHYKYFLDFADMSRSDAWINGSNAGMTYTNHAGTAVLYTSTIRIGQDHDTYQVSGMQIKNLRILPLEF